jgi:hypothetical protein
MRALVSAIAFLLAAAAPAPAADVVVRTFEEDELGTIDAYRERVVWTEGKGTLMTLEDDTAVPVGVARVGRLDVAAGPDGKPVAVYDRCTARRCTFHLYDFAARRERVLKGAPAGKPENWAFWRDRFAVIRDGRFQVVPLGGKPRDIGRARRLADEEIDFNGAGIAYVKDIQRTEDIEEFQLAYWPATGAGTGRILLRASHGALSDLSLAGARLSATRAYATQRAGEFGGPWRLWRVNLRSRTRSYAGLPVGTTVALALGSKRAIAAVCPRPEDEDPCRLVLRATRWRG